MASKRGLVPATRLILAAAAGFRRLAKAQPGSAGVSPACALAGLRRRRPPREPRRVFFFGFGCSPSPFADGASASGSASAAGAAGAASAGSSRPSEGSGRWILGASGSSSGSPLSSAAGGSGRAAPFAPAPGRPARPGGGAPPALLLARPPAAGAATSLLLGRLVGWDLAVLLRLCFCLGL